MAILITGGAGYIGSHTTEFFKNNGEEIIVVDNLQTGNKASINCDYFYEVDIRDEKALSDIFTKHSIEAVIHFAANSLVSESVKKPYEYFHNNLYGLLCL